MEDAISAVRSRLQEKNHPLPPAKSGYSEGHKLHFIASATEDSDNHVVADDLAFDDLLNLDLVVGHDRPRSRARSATHNAHRCHQRGLIEQILVRHHYVSGGKNRKG